MTLLYPDISSYQSGISLAGAPAVCIKATEGTGYANPDYDRAVSEAKAAGAFPFAYHFLYAGQAQAQAGWCHALTGGVPLMIDAEPTLYAAEYASLTGRVRPRHAVTAGGQPLQAGSRPSTEDILAFTSAYRALGGICHLVYLPRWYWQQLSGPDLRPLASQRLNLVSSDYAAYGDSGPGWQPYGGLTPAIWQFSAAYPFNGTLVDFNAFKGTLAELRSLITTGASHPRKVEHMTGQITGSKLDIALPDGVSAVRFFCSVICEISVDLRTDGSRAVKVGLGYHLAKSVAIPSGVHGIVVHVTTPPHDGTPISYAY